MSTNIVSKKRNVNLSHSLMMTGRLFAKSAQYWWHKHMEKGIEENKTKLWPKKEGNKD